MSTPRSAAQHDTPPSVLVVGVALRFSATDLQRLSDAQRDALVRGVGRIMAAGAVEREGRHAYPLLAQCSGSRPVAPRFQP